LLMISTMVPLTFLLIAIPLVAGGGYESGHDSHAHSHESGHQESGMDMQQMQQMMSMMNNMMSQQQQQQGWGKQEAQNQDNQQWWGMQNSADYEAYTKWCQEKQALQVEQKKQEELIEMYNKAEEARKVQMERESAEMAAHERSESMRIQWAQWQEKLTMVQDYDRMGKVVMEMKHKYMYAVTCEVLKFCKCHNWLDDITKYFDHEGFESSSTEWDLDDMESINGNDYRQVAQVLVGKSAEYGVKSFFGGLSTSLCEGAKTYIEGIMEMDKNTHFMSNLS